MTSAERRARATAAPSEGAHADARQRGSGDPSSCSTRAQRPATSSGRSPGGGSRPGLPPARTACA
eukprot:11200735-Lingulodinium_polyedra.AAC.1